MRTGCLREGPSVAYVDLNSDLGESFGQYKIGDDEEMIFIISSSSPILYWPKLSPRSEFRSTCATDGSSRRQRCINTVRNHYFITVRKSKVAPAKDRSSGVYPARSGLPIPHQNETLPVLRRRPGPCRLAPARPTRGTGSSGRRSPLGPAGMAARGRKETPA